MCALRLFEWFVHVSSEILVLHTAATLCANQTIPQGNWSLKKAIDSLYVLAQKYILGKDPIYCFGFGGLRAWGLGTVC